MKLEGLFADELALLQPTPGYMRLLKESVLQIWKARKAGVREQLATAERAAKAIQDKLDRLDEAFLFDRSIDIETSDRHAEKLREELTLVRIERHSGQLDELDVEGILAFAERVLPRAADLSVLAFTLNSGNGSNNCLSRRNRVRRKRLYWNPRNRTGLQLLAGNQNRKGRFGGPDDDELEPGAARATSCGSVDRAA